MKNSLEKAKADMDAATKTAQAEARAKSKTATRSVLAKTEVLQDAPAAKPVEPVKPAPQKSASLFDLPPAPATTPTAAPAEAEDDPDLQKSTMTNQSKRSKNWMTRLDWNNSSLQ